MTTRQLRKIAVVDEVVAEHEQAGPLVSRRRRGAPGIDSSNCVTTKQKEIDQYVLVRFVIFNRETERSISTCVVLYFLVLSSIESFNSNRRENRDSSRRSTYH